MKLFISYRRKDWPFTRSLVEKLRQQLDAQIFMDVDSIREDDFLRNLMNELATCDAVLLIVSPNTFAADRINSPKDWVRREVGRTLELDKPLIMAGIDGLTPPDADVLPADLRAVATKQCIGFWPDYFDAGVLKLAKFIEKATPIKRRSTVYRQWAARAGIGLAALVVLAVMLSLGLPALTPKTTATAIAKNNTATYTAMIASVPTSIESPTSHPLYTLTTANTSTATFTATPIPPTVTNSPTKTKVLSATSLMKTKVGDFPFKVQPGTPQLTSNFANTSLGCSFEGIAGQTFGLNNEPLTGIQVVITSSVGFNQTTITGSNPTFGTAGWLVQVDTKPNYATYAVELRTDKGIPVSDKVAIPFLNSCEGNLAIINFKLNRAF